MTSRHFRSPYLNLPPFQTFFIVPVNRPFSRRPARVDCLYSPIRAARSASPWSSRRPGVRPGCSCRVLRVPFAPRARRSSAWLGRAGDEVRNLTGHRAGVVDFLVGGLCGCPKVLFGSQPLRPQNQTRGCTRRRAYGQRIMRPPLQFLLRRAGYQRRKVAVENSLVRFRSRRCALEVSTFSYRPAPGILCSPGSDL